jgi:hypothetical protein
MLEIHVQEATLFTVLEDATAETERCLYLGSAHLQIRYLPRISNDVFT